MRASSIVIISYIILFSLFLFCASILCHACSNRTDSLSKTSRRFCQIILPAPVHVRPSLHEYRITTLILRLSEIGQKPKHILATSEPDGDVASESIMSG